MLAIPQRIAWSTVPEEEAVPGVTRQVIHGERQTIVRYVYQPGAVFPVHAHPEEQITMVLTGRIAFDIAGVRHELGPGDVAVIPGDTPHGAHVVGNQTVETFNALSPRRSASPRFSSARNE